LRRAAVVATIVAVSSAVPAIRDQAADARVRMPSDFNGDGYADLAIGTPEEDIAGVQGVGAVNVLYGRATGLSAAGDQLWYESVVGIPEVNGAGDMFGFALTPGDFDGDGFGDLAVGQPFADVGGIMNAGQVVVLHGSALGLTATRSQLWTQDTEGVPDEAEVRDQFGYSLTSGDFDGDGFADLAIGVQRESAGAWNSGAVEVLYGGVDGLVAGRTQFWVQGASGVADAAERKDQFGNALGVGDFDGDGRSDLAVGTEREDVGETADAGSVTVLRGTAGGLTGEGSQLWTQTAVADGLSEAGDGFGRALATGDLDGDLVDDLAVSVPLEDLAAPNVGVVDVLYGSSSGLSANGSQEWSQATNDVPGEPDSYDQFGKAVAIGDLDGDGYSDLAAGVRYDDPGGVKDAGVVNVLYGTSAGLGAGHAQLWKQDMPDVPDPVESPDHFGSCLAAADFGKNASDDIVIGTHFETLGDKTYAGSLHVLYGSPDGVRASGSQFWSQDSPGVRELSDGWDYFPAAFGVAGSGRCG